ncbi:hypothetical protein E3983_10255 [Legionella israelensis]|uniref:Uncharacterized protein n=1 Tax=Legionella israelensis TaxID=454 RepID=A0AAX1EI61_9GAMM|nr:hypothetical protein [Legionella israelensis]QBR84712.1 hypothetical protein E3983_10255 [Legionella israelensis]
MSNLSKIRENIDGAIVAINISTQMLLKPAKEDKRLGEILMPRNLTAHENNLIRVDKYLSKRELTCLETE